MIRFLADENFSGGVLKGLQRVYPDLDVVRVQDTKLYKKPDPLILEWAAAENRVILTHDVKTMIPFAKQRIEAGLPMAGMVAFPDDFPIGKAIDDLLLLLIAGTEDEWENRIERIPL